MMREEALSLLERVDREHPELEIPNGFTHEDYIALKAEIEGVEPFLKSLFPDLEIVHSWAQDAAYIARTSVLSREDPVRVQGVVGIIYSYFERLVTVVAFANTRATPAHVEKIAAYLEARGFVYIPTDVLQEKYTGQHHVRPDSDYTWLLRFFSES